jgi:hypothetical protein
MKSTVTNTAGEDTAAREMLAALRLLSIKGHVPGEQVERWEAAVDAGEPEPSRIAAIRAVLAEFDWGHDDLQYALERVDQIANSTRVDSGIEPGGGAYLTPVDLVTVLAALDQAADRKRDRAEECSNCDFDPQSPLCPGCEHGLAQADAYDTLAAKLGGAS